MKKRTLLFFAVFLLILQSCEFGLQEVSSSVNSGGEIAKVHQKSRWTFIVYMAADNNLDSSALEDFRELECADCDSEAVRTVVLFDRSQNSSGDKNHWSGTRLFEINHSASDAKSIQLNTAALGTGGQSSAELNMGDPETLISFLSFSRKYYPAEHYALIIWGHGTGYRFAGSANKTRAVAIDDTSGSFLSTPALQKAIKVGMGGDTLELIGFDTCFGAELEELYELRNEAKWFAGVVGLQEASGWNYSAWMNPELENCTQGKEVAKLIERQYSAKNEKTFAIVKMDAVQEVFDSFTAFAKKAAPLVKNKATALDLRNQIAASPQSYSASGSILNPVYAEISGMAAILQKQFSELKDDVLKLDTALKNATAETYCAAEDIFPVGIYFCSLNEKGEIADSLSEYYVHGSGKDGLCQFVQTADSYVLTANQKGSLLDKLLGNYKFSL